MEQPALNFSGDKDSWFDLWHIHTDFEGDGNKDFKTRLIFLKKLLQEYSKYKFKLEKYSRPYQIFIVIDENDSSEDAVYIHTENPNNDNFPVKIEPGKDWTCKNKQLAEFIQQTNFHVIDIIQSGNKFYYLYESDAGVSIV